jgi:hypothetical protein
VQTKEMLWIVMFKKEELLDDTTELWYIGRMVEFVKRKIISRNNNFNSINELVDWI